MGEVKHFQNSNLNNKLCFSREKLYKWTFHLKEYN